MKLRWLPALLCLGCTISLAENPPVTVYLNGRPMNVSVIETNGAFYLPVDAISKALGVHITVKTNEVRIVRELAPMPQSSPQSPRATQSSPQGITTIRGILSYRRDLMDPDHPDADAQVWLVKEEDVPALAKAAGGTAAEPIPKTQSGWASKLTSEYKFPQAVADEAGRFSFEQIAPGSYLLIMKSKTAYGLATRDRQGKIRFKKVQVGEGQVIEFWENFGPNWIGHN